MQSTFHALDIECDGCANSIQRVLSRMAGVTSVGVDVAAKAVTVEFESPATRLAIEEALDKAGFPVG